MIQPYREERPCVERPNEVEDQDEDDLVNSINHHVKKSINQDNSNDIDTSNEGIQYSDEEILSEDLISNYSQIEEYCFWDQNRQSCYFKVFMQMLVYIHDFHLKLHCNMVSDGNAKCLEFIRFFLDQVIARYVKNDEDILACINSQHTLSTLQRVALRWVKLFP